MARSHYSYEKRQKELLKKKKREEKRQKRLERKAARAGVDPETGLPLTADAVAAATEPSVGDATGETGTDDRTAGDPATSGDA